MRSSENKKTKRQHLTVRTQLLLAVNLPLTLLLAVFLVYDYRREIYERLEYKSIALEEEAKTLLPAVRQFHRGDVSGIQRFIDNVCGQMKTTDSPGHHIAVQLPSRIIQATSHGLASPEMFAAIRNAAESPHDRNPHENAALIVGMAKSKGINVYVAESLLDVQESIRAASLRRLTGLVIAFLAAAILVNFVLVRTVTNPINQLVTTVQRIGKGQLGVLSESFGSSELDYLSSEIDAMSLSLAAAERDRKTQMAKAREIQYSLLPGELQIPGLHVSRLFEPAEDVGGDFYDILPMQDDSWLICIADVTGHGIPAAMSAAMLKTLLLQAVETHVTPAELLDVINRRFVAVSLDGDFVSMILLRIKPQSDHLQYASAGHEPGWIISTNGKLRELSSTGLLLGIDEEAAWEQVVVETALGDRLAIMTDGLSETLSPEDEMFGRKRLIGLFEQTRESSLEQSVSVLREALRDFRGDTPQLDDITAVLLEFKES